MLLGEVFRGGEVMKRWQIVVALVFAAGALGGFFCAGLGIFPSHLPAYEFQQKELTEELSKLPAPSKRLVTVAKLVTPAVVHITCRGERRVHDPFADLFGEFFRRRRGPNVVPTTSFGSGVIVDKDGHVLTNHHVIRSAKKVTVKLGDGREFEAGILGSDPKTDLAVLKISASNLPTAQMGDSDKIEVGEWVLAIGNPFGLEQTVTSGIISAKGRANVGIAEFEDFIQTDAAINPGNSGGPLVNMDGKIIGITSAIASNTGGYQGIGFAIPTNMARAVMKAIIKEGQVRRGWLGVYITDLTPQLAKDLDIPYRRGAYVDDVVPDSPAAKAGLKEGDIITKVNGAGLTSARQLRNVIATTEIGKSITLTYCRGGKESECKATVVAPEPGAQFKGLETETALGMTVVNLTRDFASRYGYEGKQGVLVIKVEEDGIAAQAGIEPKDLIAGINNRRTTDIKEFRRLAREIKPGRRFRIHVWSGDTYKEFIGR
jgi:serine protease Do